MGSSGPAALQSGGLAKVEIRSKAYTVYSVLFAWDHGADLAQVLKDFSKIVTSDLGITISLRAFTFRPKSPQPSYDDRPPLRMITEVISELPAKAGSTNTELIVIFSSMLVPTAQGDSQAYFMRYVSGVGDRNVAIIGGRDAGAPWFPAKASLLPYVLAHEFGHLLGYQHENDLRCLMFPFPQEGTSFRNCLQYSAQPTPSPLAQNPPSGPRAANSAAANGQCIIATTAFGSELAPPVAFRDGSISSTSAGLGFIESFNSWYYSFSPGVAKAIGGDPIARWATKAAIYPLLAILSASAIVQSVLMNELGVVMAGALAALSIGLIYFSPIASLLTLALGRRGGQGRALNLLSKPLVWILVFVALAGGWASAGAVALILLCVVAGAGAGSVILNRMIALARS